MNRRQILGQRPWLAHQQRGVGKDAGAIPSAQEAPYRLAGGLAQYVPHGDVNSADGVSDGPAAAHPKRMRMQLLAHALRLQWVFAQIQRSHEVKRAAHQFIVGECRSPAGNAFIGEDGDERVNAIVRANLVCPAALWRAMAEPCRPDLSDFQKWTLTRV
jgi:hypothetical protein